MEVNPNHPTTQAVHDQWHKIAALVMRKLGATHVLITADDVRKMVGGNFIVVQELPDGLHVRMVDERTAMKLAREHGGMPN